MNYFPLCAMASILATGAAPSSYGIILCGTSNPMENTTAPKSASILNSGWQWQGDFNGYSGTAIGPTHFVTAHHIGGKIGNSFTFNGVNYPTIAVYNDGVTDLAVWQIQGTLPTWAPLFNGAPGSEIGREVVMIGRGVQRGSDIYTPNTQTVAGWGWGTDDRVRRWGIASVTSIFTDAQYGASLYVAFNCGWGRHTGAVTNGDSGGGMFVNTSPGIWSLAGVILSYDGPFSTQTNMSNSFNATLQFGTGYYAPIDGVLNSGPVGPAPSPSGSYATEIAPRLSFLNQFAGN